MVAGQQLFHILRRVTFAILEAESTLTAYDQVVGDGDCGTSFAKGARGILDELSNNPENGAYLPLDATADTLTTLSTVIERNMGGSAGAMCWSVHTEEPQAVYTSAESADD